MAPKTKYQSKLQVPILDTRMNKVTEYLIQCLNCGKEKWVRATFYNKDEHLFCSNLCVREYEQLSDPVLQQFNYRRGEGRYIEVELQCEYCGNLYWTRYSEVRSRGSKFCGNKCSSLYYSSTRDDLVPVGKKCGKYYWNGNRWGYWWKDENGVQHNYTGARALWESYYGDVPEGYCVLNKNPTTLDINNLYLNKGTMPFEKSYEHGKEMVRRGVFGKSGVASHRWRGGVGRTYPKEFSKNLKSRIKDRDNYTCQICGNQEFLHVHHMNRNRDDNSWENLITICESCHNLIHFSKDTTDPTILAFQALLE